MKLFLSWSGDKSHACAKALADWIPLLIQSVQPWISSGIPKGKKWKEQIAANLDEAPVGIICLTSESLESKWILFEAGALARTKGSHVCTLLLGIRPADIDSPLDEFQHTLFEREDVLKLMETICEKCAEAKETTPSRDSLAKLFDRMWPEFSDVITRELQQAPAAQKRTDRELLEEVLEIVRSLRHSASERPGRGKTEWLARIVNRAIAEKAAKNAREERELQLSRSDSPTREDIVTEFLRIYGKPYQSKSPASGED